MNKSPPRKHDQDKPLNDDETARQGEVSNLEQSAQEADSAAESIMVDGSAEEELLGSATPRSDSSLIGESTTDEQSEPSVEDVDEPSSAEVQATHPTIRKGRGAYAAFALLLLVVLTGFVAVAYYVYLVEKRVEHLAHLESMGDQIQGLSQGIKSNAALIDDRGKAIEKKNTAFQQQVTAKLESTMAQANRDFRALSAQNQQQVDMLQQRVDGHQQRLLSLSTTSREDWMLAEAEYLLKLANQRVLLERTSENAVALLESADQLVAQVSAGTGDAELFAIRKAISRDLTALKLIEPLDRDGVYLKLQALAERIDELPRVPSHGLLDADAKPGSENALEGEQPATAEEGVLNRFWAELKSMAGTLNQYIKIEDSSAPVKPLVDQHFTQMAGLNVRLLVEQAQIALLKESEVIYHSSLNDAVELIAQYYLSSQSASEFQASLSELATLNIAPNLPDISHSLQLLHTYIRQLHKIQGSQEGSQ